jgi:hypothetical protein
MLDSESHAFVDSYDFVRLKTTNLSEREKTKLNC